MNSSKNTATAVIILAGGKGTRMKSDLPKVLHQVNGREMLLRVVDAANAFKADKTLVITGFQNELVEQKVTAEYPKTLFALQEEQLGTGHAVSQAEDSLAGFEGNVIILCGDVPLIKAELLEDLSKFHSTHENAVTCVSAIVTNPTGLGRMKRDDSGRATSIVEHKDASDEEREINEINTGIFMVKAPLVFELLQSVQNSNSQCEYYLTDILNIAHNKGLNVDAMVFKGNPETLGGVNSPAQLTIAEELLRKEIR